MSEWQLSVANLVLNAVMLPVFVVAVVVLARAVRIGREVRRLLGVIREWVDVVNIGRASDEARTERVEVKAETLARAVMKMPKETADAVAEKIKQNGHDPSASGTVPVPVTVSATADGTILDVSSSAAALFQYQPQELVGRNVTVFIPERFLARHEEGMRVIRAVRVPPWESRTITGYGRRRDGGEEPVSVTLTWYADQTGAPVLTATIRRTNETGIGAPPDIHESPPERMP